MRVSDAFTIVSLLILAAGASASAQAAQVTWTEMPSSSTTWQLDPYFGAVSNNPWDIFSGATSVAFEGFDHPGGASLTSQGVHLVYNWQLSFDVPVTITNITMTGLGDNSGQHSSMRLLDANGKLVATQALTGYNTLSTTTLTPRKPVTGQVFYYEEFDSSKDARYRTSLSVTF